MAEKKELFSKEALAKLRSPERLDSMFQITNPMSWVTLGAMCLLAFSVLLWSVFGAFTEKVTGTGILLDPAGVVKVTSMSTGKVDKIMVRPGSIVKKGDVLATLLIPDIEVANKLARSNMQLSTSEKEASNNMAQYDSKNYNRKMNGVLVSAYDGIVDQVNIIPDAVVSTGTDVCTIRLDNGLSELGGVLYVPAADGHKVTKGMLLQLVPSGFDSDKDGQLLARVIDVSRYPVAATGVQKRVANDTLANAILSSQSNTCLEVSFQLVKDAKAPSGYLWTSIPGPEKKLHSGAMVSGFAVVDRVPPIEKLFYNIRSLLRSR